MYQILKSLLSAFDYKSKDLKIDSPIYPTGYVPTEQELLPKFYSQLQARESKRIDWLANKSYPACSIAQIISLHSGLIETIRFNSGLSDRSFQTLMLPVIRNLAALCHLLPVSRSDHHSIPAGQFKHALEVGLYSFLESELAFMENFDRRLEFEWDRPRWILGCFVGGILHGLRQLFIQVRVSSSNCESPWDPTRRSLHQWIVDNNVEWYEVHWLPETLQKPELAKNFILGLYLCPDTLSYLEDANPDIVQNLNSCIRDSGNHSKLGRIVANSCRRSRFHNLKNQDGDDRLVSLITEFSMFNIKTRRWSINTPGTDLWFLQDRLYLNLENSWQEISQIIGKPCCHTERSDLCSVGKRLVSCGFAEDPTLGYQIGSLDAGAVISPFWRVEVEIKTHRGGRERFQFRALQLADPMRILSQCDVKVTSIAGMITFDL